jgi:hypothetical protein
MQLQIKSWMVPTYHTQRTDLGLKRRRNPNTGKMMLGPLAAHLFVSKGKIACKQKVQ